MKAVILDMYGVIVKQTGDDFVPYVHRTFPDLPENDILTPWFKADVGALTSLDVWRILGFTGDWSRSRRNTLIRLNCRMGFMNFYPLLRGIASWRSSPMIPAVGAAIFAGNLTSTGISTSSASVVT